MQGLTDNPASIFAGTDATARSAAGSGGRAAPAFRCRRHRVSRVGQDDADPRPAGDAGGANTAVIVNEFGEVGIDDALLRGSSDTTVLLGNGCVCCLMRSDLQETLRTFSPSAPAARRRAFERVIIETSGLADPGPVLQTFASDRALGEEFHLQSLVAVVDAVAGRRQPRRMEEARHQVALADRIVMTKTDLADAAAADALTRQLARAQRRAGRDRA